MAHLLIHRPTVDADDQTDTATINIEAITFEVIIPDNNGATVIGNESVVEGQSFLNGSFTIVSSVGLGITTALSISHESGDSLDLSLFQLASLATENQPLGTMAGELVLTDYDSMTRVVNYQYNAVVSDHSGGDFSVDDTFTITAVNVSPSTTSSMLNFLITDTNPVANNDARTMFEGTSAIAGNAVGTLGASNFGDNEDTIIDSPASVTGLGFEGVDGTVGTPLGGEFGTLNISSVGVYTYTLDNTNPAVQGLKFGESEVDVFTYTVTDNEAPNADSDTATIAVTVFGIDDPAPTITVADLDASAAGDQSVTEATSSTINGTITVNASAGIDELTIDNQDLTNATVSNITVNGSEGTLVISSFNPSTGVISYNFTEDGNNESHNATDDNVVDSFTISLLDNEGDSAIDTLDILITDTAPTAASDNNSITEDQSFPVTGDVLINDTSGADTAISVFAIDFDGVSRTVGQPFDTEFGTLDLNADGTYTYTLDNTNPAVQALGLGDIAEEIFTYTIADTDGDLSSNSLFITINGADE